MQNNEFMELLQLHGSDIATWPADKQAEAAELLRLQPELHYAASAEASFERDAHMRRVGEADAAWIQGIIDASARIEQQPRRRLLQELKALLPLANPSPVFAMLAVVGFLWGFSSNVYEAAAVDDSYTAILFENGSSL